MEIKSYKPGDEQHILALFKAAFGKDISLDFWKWRYANNPFTDNKMINMMWDGDILAGHYAVSPVDLNIEGDIVRTALSMTTMTHPSYNGKGVFTSLAEDLYKHISQNEGVEAIWGFPNLNSHYGLNTKLGWSDIATVPTLRLNRQRFNTLVPVNYTVNEVFTDQHQILLDTYSKAKIIINKTTSYLNWRYTCNPTNTYYILNTDDTKDEHFVVFKVFEPFDNLGIKEIDIVEQGFGASLSVIRSLLGGILQFAIDQKIELNSINTWMPIHDSRHVLLERCKFILDTPITVFGSRTYTARANKLLNFKNWSLTMGGSDIY